MQTIQGYVKRGRPSGVIGLMVVMTFGWWIFQNYFFLGIELSHPFWQPPPDSKQWMDIVTAVEGPAYYKGMVALLNSSFYYNRNEKLPLRFHILVPQSTYKQGRLHKVLRLLFADFYSLSPGAINIIGFDTKHAKQKVFVWQGTSRHRNYLNYARFWLPQLLPSNVKRVVYLDGDIVVQGNLREALAVLDNTTYALAAVPVLHSKYDRFLSWNSDFVEANIDRSQITFNAGVLVIDIERWKQYQITEKLEWWMDLHRHENLWKYGSQPPLLITFFRGWKFLDASWNVDGLGYARVGRKPAEVQAANVLHWNGPRKPWNLPVWDGLIVPNQPIDLRLPHREYYPFWSRFYTVDRVITVANEAGFQGLELRKYSRLPPLNSTIIDNIVALF